MSLPPTLILSSTSSFILTYNDKGSHADMDGSFYRPQTTNFICGDYCQGNYNPPVGQVLTLQVENEDPANPLLKAPTGYSMVWDDKHSHADMDGSVWFAQPPEGYVSVGYVSQNGYDTPNITNMRCVRNDLVTAASIGALIWSDKGSGASMDVSIYSIIPPPSIDAPFGLFYAQPNYNPPVGSVFAVKGSSGGAAQLDLQTAMGPVRIIRNF